MSAPVNVLLQQPTIHVPDWADEAQQWGQLNAEAKGNSEFYPLTVKAAYVVGVIHTICQSVSILLSHKDAMLVGYIPAYGVFASAIELLGRCLKGNSDTRGSVSDLEAGFQWLASTHFDDYHGDYLSVPKNIVLVQTGKYMYSIDNLVALRHFAAHGQATAEQDASGHYQFGYIDYEILAHMPPLLANGLDAYWAALRSDEFLCNCLAKARVIALRKWPVFLSWSKFEKDDAGKYHSIGEIFSEFNWVI